MPVNSDGETVDRNGEAIDPKDLETANWLDVEALKLNDNVKPLKIETLAPTCVPINIPYFEAYRTDELYYKEYESPFLSSTSDSTGTGGDSSGDGDSSGGDSSDDGSGGSLWTALATIVDNHIEVSAGKKNQYIQRLRGADTNWTAIAKIVNDHKIKGNATQNTVIRAILNAKKNNKDSNSGGGSSSGKSSSKKGGVKGKYSSKTKNAKLQKELLIVVKRYFKKEANHTTLVNRYMASKTNKVNIAIVSSVSSKWLKNKNNIGSLNKAILNVKKKYG